MSSKADLTGEKLGQYELREVIGRGGMGTIYRAYHPAADRDVAIKVIAERYASHPVTLRRFEQEARINARLLHPHILPVFDVGTLRGLTYIVMAYMGGGTLAYQIAAHPTGMDLNTVIRVSVQIASALDFAHRLGIIHRDLKPGNILFDHNGHAYLSDFGIAHAPQESESELVMLGTYAYMAPEAVNESDPSPSNDIYSLGVILYEALVGQRPFKISDYDSLLTAHAGGAPPNIQAYRPDVPTGVAVVIGQALATDPYARPPHAEALATALVRASSGALSQRSTRSGGGNGQPLSLPAKPAPLPSQADGPGTPPIDHLSGEEEKDADSGGKPPLSEPASSPLPGPFSPDTDPDRFNLDDRLVEADDGSTKMDLDLKNLMPPTEPSMSTRAEPARIAPLKEASPSPSPLQKPEPKPRPRRVAQSSWRREAAAWLVGTLMVLGLLAAFLLVMLSMEGGGP